MEGIFFKATSLFLKIPDEAFAMTTFWVGVVSENIFAINFTSGCGVDIILLVIFGLIWKYLFALCSLAAVSKYLFMILGLGRTEKIKDKRK